MYIKDGVHLWQHEPLTDKWTGYEEHIQSLNLISPVEFVKLNETDQMSYVKEVLTKIRQINIYPIYYYNEVGIRNEILKCATAEVEPLVGNVTEQGRAGSTLLDFMFPNLHLVNSGNATDNCMYKRFYDDAKLTKCLLRHMKNYMFTNMRTPFFMYGRFFWSTATNFNVMKVRSIVEKYCPVNGTVYDFSAGFGARMLGTLSSMKSNFKYIGCEPCLETYHNLNKLGKYIEQVSGRHNSFYVYPNCSEELYLPDNLVDFAFSCPPYFALERYSTEDTQSYLKYPSYNDWLRGYVYETLSNIHIALKPEGYLGFVVADIIHYRNKPYSLGADWCKAATECGFELCKVHNISSRSRKSNDSSEKLYIFKKKVI